MSVLFGIWLSAVAIVYLKSDDLNRAVNEFGKRLIK